MQGTVLSHTRNTCTHTHTRQHHVTKLVHSLTVFSSCYVTQWSNLKDCVVYFFGVTFILFQITNQPVTRGHQRPLLLLIEKRLSQSEGLDKWDDSYQVKKNCNCSSEPPHTTAGQSVQVLKHTNTVLCIETSAYAPTHPSADTGAFSLTHTYTLRVPHFIFYTGWVLYEQTHIEGVCWSVFHQQQRTWNEYGRQN